MYSATGDGAKVTVYVPPLYSLLPPRTNSGRASPRAPPPRRDTYARLGETSTGHFLTANRPDTETRLYFFAVIVLIFFFLIELRDAKRSCSCYVT